MKFLIFLITLSSVTAMAQTNPPWNDKLIKPSEIIVFNSAVLSSGNLGSRSGADALCAAAKPSSLSCPTAVHALLSVSSHDSIAKMPANYGFSNSTPLKLQNGTEVASSFAEVLVGNSVFNTDVLSSLLGHDYFMTGSNYNGTLSKNNCNGWTSSAAKDSFDAIDPGNESLYPETGTCNNARIGNVIPVVLLCFCY